MYNKLEYHFTHVLYCTYHVFLIYYIGLNFKRKLSEKHFPTINNNKRN